MSKQQTSFSFAWIMFLIGFVLGIVVAVWVMNYIKPVAVQTAHHSTATTQSAESKTTSATPAKSAGNATATTQNEKPVAQQVPAPAPVANKDTTTNTDVGHDKPVITVKPTTESETPVASATAPASTDANTTKVAQKNPPAKDEIADLVRAEKFKPTYVQVAAVSTSQGVQTVKAQLQLAGFHDQDIHVKTVHRKTTLYRVYLGPFKTDKALTQVKRRLDQNKMKYTLFY